MKTLVVRLALICASLIVISLMLIGQSFAKIDPKTIAGLWLFDEGKGDIAKDSSGKGNDGTLENAPKWVDGKFGKALEFDGKDNYVDAGNGSSLNLSSSGTAVIATARHAEKKTKAQKKVKAEKEVKGAGGGGFMFGMNILDVEELNAELKKRGFDELDEVMPFFGGSGFGLINDRILLGGEGGGFFQSVSSETQKATFGGGYGFFDVGYVVLKKGGLKMFPLVGFGGGGISLRITESWGKLTFDEIIADPKREATIATGGFLMHAAIGADYWLTLEEDKEGKGGLLIGIRAGYIYSPMKADWKMGDVDILKGPDVRPGGFYIHLVFGGGGEGKN